MRNTAVPSIVMEMTIYKWNLHHGTRRPFVLQCKTQHFSQIEIYYSNLKNENIRKMKRIMKAHHMPYKCERVKAQ